MINTIILATLFLFIFVFVEELTLGLIDLYTKHRDLVENYSSFHTVVEASFSAIKRAMKYADLKLARDYSRTIYGYNRKGQREYEFKEVVVIDTYKKEVFKLSFVSFIEYFFYFRKKEGELKNGYNKQKHIFHK